jgi:hypothetical protein
MLDGVSFSYPRDLEERVRLDWPADHPPDPLASHRPALLEVAYQASTYREEDRPVRVRLLLARPDDRNLEGDLDDLHVLELDRSRPCDVGELRRIAAAAPFETALVCVAPQDGELRIWGIGWSGAQWLAPTWGGRGQRSGCYVPRTIVHVYGPGRVAVYSGERFIASLELGTIVTLATDVFASKWLPALFDEARAEVLALHERDRGPESATIDESLVKMIGQHLLRRALWLMRAGHHGGMLLFAEPADAEALLAGPLRAKYRFTDGEPRARYRTLVRALTAELARTRTGAVTASDFMNASGELSDVEAAIFELARLVASLSSVDGAVLLTKRFEIIAFGVEVVSESVTLSPIRRALDSEGNRCTADDEENVGTRHRAAYRFVQMHPNGLAIVVSQDGTVRFVVRIGDRIKYFEQHLVG